MKFNRWIGAGLLACCISDRAAGTGAGVPGLIDRPTPPACCADGICYPNPTTWGTYPTRWRRWPGEVLAPTPADAAAPRPDGELPTLEPPGPEDEDRRAPPPTLAPEAAEPGANGDIRRPPSTPPTTPPTTPPMDTPRTTPLTPPQGLDTTPGTPFEDDDPTETENLLPFHSQIVPQNDDPPPPPPFRAPIVAKAPRERKAGPPNAVAAPAPAPVDAPRAAAPTPSSDSDDDPPPAFPLSLG